MVRCVCFYFMCILTASCFLFRSIQTENLEQKSLARLCNKLFSGHTGGARRQCKNSDIQLVRGFVYLVLNRMRLHFNPLHTWFLAFHSNFINQKRSTFGTRNWRMLKRSQQCSHANASRSNSFVFFFKQKCLKEIFIGALVPSFIEPIEFRRVNGKRLIRRMRLELEYNNICSVNILYRR